MVKGTGKWLLILHLKQPHHILLYLSPCWTVVLLLHPYPPHRAAGTWWRSEGCPWSQPCSRRPPDALCWGSAGQIPWWGHRSPAYRWLRSPLEGPPCAGTPWPVHRSHDRAPQQAGSGAGTRSQSGWQRGRRGCPCLFCGTEMWHQTMYLGINKVQGPHKTGSI